VSLHEQVRGRFLASDYSWVANNVPKISGFSTDPDLMFMVGQSLANSGRPEAGIPYIRRSLAINPLIDERWCVLCDHLAESGFSQEAERIATDRLRYTNSREYYYIIAYCLTLRKQYEAAVLWYKEYLKKDPLNVTALNNLGNCYRFLGDPHSAIEYYKEVVRLKPDHVTTMCNLIPVLMDIGRIEEAKVVGEVAMKNPAFLIEGAFNYSLVLLATGDYLNGWALYQLRNRIPQFQDSVPKIKGERLISIGKVVGKPVTVHHEQGYGDTLHFCRYLPFLAKIASEVHVVAPKPLHSLLELLPGIKSINDRRMQDTPYECAMLDLPYLFQTTLNTIPNNNYFEIPKDVVKKRKLKTAKSSKLKVGLVWAGERRAYDPVLLHTDMRRSTKLSQWTPILEVEGIDFYSMQYGTPAGEVLELPEHLQPIDLKGPNPDFLDTAAGMAQLDLMISVDTSSCHLSAGMGIPTWVLSRFDSCWRWLQNQPTTRWYPSMRIFGQQKWGEWDSVMQEIAEELKKLVTSRKS